MAQSSAIPPFFGNVITMKNSDDWLTRERDVISRKYRFPELVLSKANGIYVIDTKGKKYLDFTSGGQTAMQMIQTNATYCNCAEGRILSQWRIESPLFCRSQPATGGPAKALAPLHAAV